MQIKVAVEPIENSRSPIGDSARDPARGLVRSHDGNLTGGTQLQPQQNRGLSEGVQLQPQQDIDTMGVDIPEVFDPYIVEVAADFISVNRADDLTNSDSDSEMRVRIIYLKKKGRKLSKKLNLSVLNAK